MNKALKFILIGVVALVVVVGVVLTLVVANLDKIVKVAVEKVGTRTLGTEVTLESVDVSLKTGAGGLNGLVIDNPGGFSATHAFELDKVSFDLDLGTVTSDEVVIEQVVVDGARVVFEENGGRINLQVLLNNVETAPDTGQAPPDEGTDGQEGPALVIKEFRFTNAETRLMTEQFGQDVTVTIPDVILEGIGSKGGGVTAAEAARQLLEPLIRQVIKGAQQEALEQAREKATKGLMDKLGF